MRKLVHFAVKILQKANAIYHPWLILVSVFPKQTQYMHSYWKKNYENINKRMCIWFAYILFMTVGEEAITIAWYCIRVQQCTYDTEDCTNLFL